MITPKPAILMCFSLSLVNNDACFPQLVGRVACMVKAVA